MNIQDITNFIDTFLEKVTKLGIDYSKYNIDHVAYQASSTEDFVKVKEDFNIISTLKHEAVLAERRVAVFELTNPIEYKNNKITALEVIESKPGQVCESGWEHAEFVINESFEELMAKYPTLEWDTSSANRSIYAHLKLRLDPKTQLKFHRMDILETIKLDK